MDKLLFTFYKSEMRDILRYINKCLIKWVMRKYKNQNSKMQARKWLQRVANNNVKLFAHWKFEVIPMA